MSHNPTIDHTVGRPGKDRATVFAREKANCSEIFWRVLCGWGYYDEPFKDFRTFHTWRWQVYHKHHPPPRLDELVRASREEDHPTILCLRDPVDRAVSMWKHYQSHFPEFRVYLEQEPYPTIETFFGALGSHWGRDGLVCYAPRNKTGKRLDTHWASQAFDGIQDINWTLRIPVEHLHDPEPSTAFRTLTGIDIQTPFESNHWHAPSLHPEEIRARVRPFVEALYPRDTMLYADIVEQYRV